MKYKLSACAIVFILLFISVLTNQSAHAMACNVMACESGLDIAGILPGCEMVDCYGGGEIGASCASCMVGFTRKQMGDGFVPGQNCNFPYYICIRNCAECSNCTSDPNWISYIPGHDRKTEKLCNCGTCTTSYRYRCSDNYYGTSASGVSGCTLCNKATNHPESVSAPDTRDITGCFLPSGTDDEDNTGYYTHTKKCYYNN